MGHNMMTFSYLVLISAAAVSGQFQNVQEIIGNAVHEITANSPTRFSDFPNVKHLDKEYDFIIVGCGTSGSILANRLSKISSFHVLCLEAGDEESAMSVIPLTAPYLSQTAYNWGYKTTHQDGICEGMTEERCSWPRGKATGGSSAINLMIYTRGNPEDYNKWASLGNEGWSYEDVLPYFKQFEKVGIQDIQDLTTRGTDGELNIQYSPYQTELVKSQLQAGIEMGLSIRDYNDKEQIGISRIQATLKQGKRLSGAKAFLTPIRGRSNLQIVKNAFVTKIIIDQKIKEAKGVEISIRNMTRKIYAKREVILSAGALNSPQILMLSGIGPKKHLESLDIDVIEDLPVGKNLQDHLTFVGINFLVNQSVTLIDVRIASNPEYVNEYVSRGEGPYTIPGGCEVISFINTNDNKTESPDIELLFNGGAFSGGYGRGIWREFGLKDEIFNDVYVPVLGRDGFVILPVNLKPKSVGYMELQSKNPFEFPKFFPNYYRDERDLLQMLRGIRWAIKFGETQALKKFKPVLYDKPFKACAQYPFNSDEYWMCSAKLLSTTLFHQVGTCKMGPKGDKTAVVDPQLRVIGIKNLRVVDASIMPEITSGHTQAPSYMIGAKAADLIKQDHGY